VETWDPPIRIRNDHQCGLRVANLQANDLSENLHGGSWLAVEPHERRGGSAHEPTQARQSWHRARHMQPHQRGCQQIVSPVGGSSGSVNMRKSQN
jgi:hypothetical protein